MMDSRHARTSASVPATSLALQETDPSSVRALARNLEDFRTPAPNYDARVAPFSTDGYTIAACWSVDREQAPKTSGVDLCGRRVQCSMRLAARPTRCSGRTYGRALQKGIPAKGLAFGERLGCLNKGSLG